MVSGFEKSRDGRGPGCSRAGLAIRIPLVVLVMVVGVIWMSRCAAKADPIRAERFTVTDGDTIRLHGREFGTRLVGFNAPEKDRRRAACEAERRLGVIAKARLKEIVSKGQLDLTFVPCSCPLGTEGTDSCNFSRSCAILRSNGRDVGNILIADGMAVPFHCGKTSCPPTPRPWCGEGR